MAEPKDNIKKKYLGHFKCSILSPKKLLYEKEVNSVFLRGDQGEFEILAYHHPVIGILLEGDIVVDWKDKIPVKGGIVRFLANECTILVEENLEKEIEIS